MHLRFLSGLAVALAVPAAVFAQGTSASTGQTTPVTLPTVTVTAQKEPTDAQRLPVSVTVVPAEWLTFGSTVTDAGLFAPNTYFSEFSARKLTNARFRGIGAPSGNLKSACEITPAARW